MSRRTVDWNKGLAADLHDPEFVREFIRAALEEEDIPIQTVLRKVILLHGLKEFAKRVKIPSSNISRALNPSYNPTMDTINRLLKPFGLRLAIAPIKKVA